MQCLSLSVSLHLAECPSGSSILLQTEFPSFSWNDIRCMNVFNRRSPVKIPQVFQMYIFSLLEKDKLPPRGMSASFTWYQTSELVWFSPASSAAQCLRTGGFSKGERSAVSPCGVNHGASRAACCSSPCNIASN